MVGGQISATAWARAADVVREPDEPHEPQTLARLVAEGRAGRGDDRCSRADNNRRGHASTCESSPIIHLPTTPLPRDAACHDRPARVKLPATLQDT